MPIVIQHGDVVPYLSGTYLLGQRQRQQEAEQQRRLEEQMRFQQEQAQRETAARQMELELRRQQLQQQQEQAQRELALRQQELNLRFGQAQAGQPAAVGAGLRQPQAGQPAAVQPPPMPRTPRAPSVPDWYRGGLLEQGERRLDINQQRAAEQARHNQMREALQRDALKLQQEALDFRTNPQKQAAMWAAKSDIEIQSKLNLFESLVNAGYKLTPEQEWYYRFVQQSMEHAQRDSELERRLAAQKERAEADRRAEFYLQTERASRWAFNNTARVDLQGAEKLLDIAHSQYRSAEAAYRQAAADVLRNPAEVEQFHRRYKEAEAKLQEALRRYEGTIQKWAQAYGAKAPPTPVFEQELPQPPIRPQAPAGPAQPAPPPAVPPMPITPRRSPAVPQTPAAPAEYPAYMQTPDGTLYGHVGDGQYVPVSPGEQP